ncbi:MAG TPA: hypothetical protein VL053_09390 [Arachidicoccus sp.]|nr:hypothetical protein [Arachidicoccus sp.]
MLNAGLFVTWVKMVKLRRLELNRYLTLMKLRILLLLLLTCICCKSGYTQKLSTESLIEAWKTQGKDQTRRAEITYDDLLHNLDAQAFLKKIDSLKDYIDHHDNQRLWVRLIIYEVYGHRRLVTPFKQIYVTNLKKAITIAGLLKDDQLLSELYTYYADNYVNHDVESRLFYILKAMDLQRKIGFQYFPHVYLRFVSISKAMYRTMDYRQSIQYGLECLALLKSPANDPINFILQLDLIGASCKNLGMADSTDFYYRRINRILDQGHALDSSFKQIWRGVAAGGIAQAKFLKGDYAQAYQLLAVNIQSSRKYEQWSDAAMAGNAMAKINYYHKNYDSALHYWNEAYKWSEQSNDLINIIPAAEGIASVYKQLGDFDSAFFYVERFHLFRDSLQMEMNACKLSTLKAQVEFDDMQASLAAAEHIIDRQHQIRNIILGCVALLGIIAIFLYNRYRLKQDIRQQILERKNKIAAMEVARAKEQIASFASNLKEKEQLIRELKQKMQQDTATDDYMAERLKNYSLVTDEAWAKFKGEFITAYPNFFPRLYKVLHKMTPAEERLTALIYLRLSNQLIAGTLGISKESVSRGKRRLNQRMMLPPDVSMENFLLQDEEYG